MKLYSEKKLSRFCHCLMMLTANGAILTKNYLSTGFARNSCIDFVALQQMETFQLESHLLCWISCLQKNSAMT